MSVSVGDMSHIAALLTRRHPQLELYVYGVQRTTKRRTGGILMARGRDATDIAIVTSFGPCTLAGFKVITHRSLHLLQCSHANQTHRLKRHAKLLRESPQRDRDLGKPARLEDVALPIIKHARRLRKHLRSCFLMITSTSKS